ncbi:WD domain, G-beta repeat domain containing protein [Plasmodium vivax]|uniref:WD domain, G-beta repeat domain containing protein n=1 Tax=Plasmodium vivax TaxID=5855 RepID=A0A1G4GV98_PLAVI|nr:WD domain, G-beta repeat domain containing protein [Plasmodium vivax]
MAPPPELLPPIGHLLKLEKDVKKKIAEKEHQMRVTFFFLNLHKLGNPLLPHKKNYRTRWSSPLQMHRCWRHLNGRIKPPRLEIHTRLIKKKCHLKKERVRKRGRRKEEGAFPAHPPDVASNGIDERREETTHRGSSNSEHSIKLIREIKLESSNSVLSLAQSSDVRYLLAGLDSGALHIYDFAYAEKGTGKKLPTKQMRKCPIKSSSYKEHIFLAHRGALTNVQFSKVQGGLFLTVGMDKKIKIWKIRNGDKHHSNKSQTNNSFNLSFICEGAFDEHIAKCMFHPSVQNSIIIALSNGVIKIANIVAKRGADNNLTRSGKTTRIFKKWTARFTAKWEDKSYAEFCSATGMSSHLCSNNCRMLTKNNFQSVDIVGMATKQEEKSYEKNFLKNMNRLRKKKKKKFQLVVASQMLANFPICTLAVQKKKNFLFVGMCNGVVSVYTDKYELRRELLCRSKRAACAEISQICSIDFEENLQLIIITSAPSRVSIFDDKDFFLIYKCGGHMNCAKLLEVKAFLKFRGVGGENVANSGSVSLPTTRRQFPPNDATRSDVPPNVSGNKDQFEAQHRLITPPGMPNVEMDFKIIAPVGDGQITISNFTLCLLGKYGSLPDPPSEFYEHSKKRVKNFFWPKLRKPRGVPPEEENVPLGGTTPRKEKSHTSMRSFLSNTTRRARPTGKSFLRVAKRNFLEGSPSVESHKGEACATLRNLPDWHSCMSDSWGEKTGSTFAKKRTHRCVKKERPLCKSGGHSEYFLPSGEDKISASSISDEFLCHAYGDVYKSMVRGDPHGRALHDPGNGKKKCNLLQKIKKVLFSKNNSITNQNGFSPVHKMEEASPHRKSPSCSAEEEGDGRSSKATVSKCFLIVTGGSGDIRIFLCRETG